MLEQQCVVSRTVAVCDISGYLCWNDGGATAPPHFVASEHLDDTRTLLGRGQAGEEQGWVEMERGQVS